MIRYGYNWLQGTPFFNISGERKPYKEWVFIEEFTGLFLSLIIDDFRSDVNTHFALRRMLPKRDKKGSGIPGRGRKKKGPGDRALP